MSTAAPPPAYTAPSLPATAPFVVPAISKRVRLITPEGQEEQADDNPWIHMELKDPFEQQAPQDNQAAAAAGQEDAAAGAAAAAAAAEQPKPEAVMKAFASAKGELEWLQALLLHLQEGKYLTVGKVEKEQGLQRIADLAVAANSRFHRRSAAAAAAAAALSEGARALEALGQKEDAFYEQVAQLQRYWKVQTEPADSPYAYSVNLRVHSSSSSSDSDDALPAAAAAAIGRGPVSVVKILKDPSGMLRVQVPAKKASGPPTVTQKAVAEPPAVYTGPAAIHALLLQQLRLNAWHVVLETLDAEITQYLGLPARLQPGRTAAAAAGSRAGSATQQQQQQAVSATSNLTAAAAAPPAAVSESLQSASAGTQATAAAACLGSVSGTGSTAVQRPGVSSNTGGHFTFYTTLSSLVLQAVIGSAATAGEEAVLEQQQQQQQQGIAAAAAAAADVVVDGPASHAATPATVDGTGSASEGLILGELDVGGPWERAAAAAAGERLLLQQPGAAAAAGVANDTAAGVIIDAQLLSLRPFALQHVLLTQLGHLLTAPWRGTDSVTMAAAAYATAARHMQERQRQRQDQQRQLQQVQAGGASSSKGLGVSGGLQRDGSTAAAAAGGCRLAVLPQASMMTSLSRWLAHSGSRELVRLKLDEVLAKYPGIAAKTLQSCHSCISAVLVAPTAAALGTSNSSSSSSRQAAKQQRSTATDGGVDSSVAAAPLLVLLNDMSITLEGANLGVVSGARGLLGQHSRARDVQQQVAYLHALPGLLQPLLDQMIGISEQQQQQQ